MFEIVFSTTKYAPPRGVTVRTPNNDWQAIAGSYQDGGWVFSLDETQVWDKPTYFKFFLDGEYWMDDPYLLIAPVAGSAYTYDETKVTFSMDTAPVTPIPVPPVVVPVPSVVPPVSEGAITNRIVVMVTPFLTIGAAWLSGVIARHVPGVKLDQTQVVSFMIAIVAVCLASAWKWLQGWQQHELLVAQKLAAPIKAVIVPPTGSGNQQ